MTVDLSARQGRRTFLAAIAAAATGAIAATVTGAQRVFAAGDDGRPIVVGGSYTDAHSSTVITNKSSAETTFMVGSQGGGAAILALSRGGSGIDAGSDRFSGIRAHSDTGPGVHAMSGYDGTAGRFPAAVIGEVSLPDSASIIGNNYAGSGTAQGVQGTSDSPKGLGVTGLARKNGTAVLGASGPDFPTGVPAKTGVYGYAQNGRGGVFEGKTAQLRLVPSTAASHPSSGSIGDLFLDKNKRLWFCKGGTSWKQIA
jgi:hypothetical protein